MKHYIYRLSGQNTSTNDHTFNNLRKRGLGVLITETHPHLLEYTTEHSDYQTLYIETQPTENPDLVSDWCVGWTREYSISHNAMITLVNRMIDVRAEWSRCS